MIDPLWFASDGLTAVVMAVFFFAIALGTLAWLRGPGGRPHDPPVARDAVRWFAVGAALFGGLWLVRGVAGVGGYVIVVAVVLVASLAMVVRRRAGRS